MNNTSYLVSRLCKQKGVKELTVEDVTMEQLFIAFSADASPEAVKVLKAAKIPSLAIDQANKLKTGKSVAVYDQEQNAVFYVNAFGEDLVAITQPLGPWYEIYAARSTNNDLLEEMGITTPTFKDRKLIDGVFNFPLEGKGIPPVIQHELLEVTEQPAPWYRAAKPKPTTEEQLDARAEAEAEVAAAMSNLTEAAMKLATTAGDVEMESTIQTQMAKAFDRMHAMPEGQKPTRREGRRAARKDDSREISRAG